MESSQVAVATMTWARTHEEEDVLRRSLTKLAAGGLRVAVADAGTASGFLQFLKRLPEVSVIVPSERGLVAQVKASLAAAGSLDTRFILYTEPDKEFFFERQMHDFLRAAEDGDDVGAVLAARSAGSFATFPPMQQYTEGVINTLCAELIGVVGDYSYGPFLMNRSLLPFVVALGPHLGWGWRHFVFRTAHQQGLRVIPIVGDYSCPEDQRTEDDSERAHRLRQLSQNLLGLVG
jgi:hypothetical protein